MRPDGERLLQDLLAPRAKALPRPKIHTPRQLDRKVERCYFDADRFRWYFHKREGRTLAQWREAIDEEMRKEEALETP